MSCPDRTIQPLISGSFQPLHKSTENRGRGSLLPSKSESALLPRHFPVFASVATPLLLAIRIRYYDGDHRSICLGNNPFHGSLFGNLRLQKYSFSAFFAHDFPSLYAPRYGGPLCRNALRVFRKLLRKDNRSKVGHSLLERHGVKTNLQSGFATEWAHSTPILEPFPRPLSLRRSSTIGLFFPMLGDLGSSSLSFATLWLSLLRAQVCNTSLPNLRTSSMVLCSASSAFLIQGLRPRLW